jgi:uncharacterized integral membrane protein
VIVVLVLAIIVIVQNTQVVTFRFLFWQVSMSQILQLLLTLIVGFVLGFLIRPLLRKSSSAGKPSRASQ